MLAYQVSLSQGIRKRKRKNNSFVEISKLFFQPRDTLHFLPDLFWLKCPTVKNFTTFTDPFLNRDGKGSKEVFNFKIYFQDLLKFLLFLPFDLVYSSVESEVEGFFKGF